MRFAFTRVLTGRLAWVYLEEKKKKDDVNSLKPNWTVKIFCTLAGHTSNVETRCGASIVPALVGIFSLVWSFRDLDGD